MSGLDRQQRRRARVRRRLRAGGHGRVRLSVFRSARHMYAQLIDDKSGRTLAAASSLEKAFAGAAGATKEGAEKVGRLLAERAQKAGHKKIVFDRGAYLYHGRVKALAQSARAAGLEF